MMKMERGMTTWFEHIKNTLSAEQVVGIDYTQYPAEPLKNRIEFFEKAGITVKSVPNLVDAVWSDRPARPSNEVKVLDL